MMELAEEIERRLRAEGTPERAAAEKAYLKSPLDFLGATVPMIRRTVRGALAEQPGLGHDQVVTLVLALWAKPIHERRMAAVEVLERHVRLLAASDLSLLERLVRDSGTWALVDALANVIGRMVADEAGEDLAEPMDRWARDPDHWIRRASLLAELRSVRDGDGPAFERFLRRAEPMIEEREFFIRKAIGWVLREAGRRRPGDVVSWLTPRTHRASGVTMREAVKYLDASARDRLIGAYREGRPAS